MAKFLDTAGVSYYLQKLVNNSNEKLILISPYLKLSDRLKQSLEDKDRMKIDVRLIYGKSELHPAENNWLALLTSIRVSFLQNLHAKCYLSENEAIVTSMNLYDFSQENNCEMGIHINKTEDGELYTALYDEVTRIMRISNEKNISELKVSQGNGKRKVRIVKTTPLTPGFCIRCKAKIKLNPLLPYCRECYGSWKKYENQEYEEKYCHICGEHNKSSKQKPGCYYCYNINKRKPEFSLV